MSELPKGWTKSNLGYTCEMYQPQTISKSEMTADGPYPVFGANGIIGRYHEFNYEESQLLMTCRGATCGTINVSEPMSWITGNSMVIRPRSSEIDRSFLEQYLRGGAGISDAITGSAQPQITRASLEPVELLIPPLPEQRRIVKKVASLTARTARARKELDRIPTLISRYKQRLLALAFSGELTGETGGWRTATIGDLADTQLGKMLDKAKNKGEPTKYLRNINVRWYDFELDDVLEMPMSDEERRKFAIKDGDILTCEGGEPGRSAIWNKGPTDLAFQKALIRIRPDLEQLNPSYLVHHLKFLADAQELERHFTGSTIKHLPQRALQGVELPVPPIEEQAEIVRRIESAFGWLDRMAADHAAAARLLPKLDAAILTKAFRGELVPQDPNDEPASVLLGRIKAEREAEAKKPKTTRARQRVHHLQAESISTGPAELGVPTLTVTSRKRKEAGMTKSRQDDDVKGQPYLASLLKSMRFSDAQSLFRAADLPVADFYKQLAWEIEKGHIVDNPEKLKAA